jgi:hypothetical protein
MGRYRGPDYSFGPSFSKINEGHHKGGLGIFKG